MCWSTYTDEIFKCYFFPWWVADCKHTVPVGRKKHGPGKRHWFVSGMWSFLHMQLPFRLFPLLPLWRLTLQWQVSSGSRVFTRNICLGADETHPAQSLRFYAGSLHTGFTSCHALRSGSNRFCLQTSLPMISSSVIEHELNLQEFFFLKSKLDSCLTRNEPGPAAAFCSSKCCFTGWIPVCPARILPLIPCRCTSAQSGWATVVQRLSHFAKAGDWWLRLFCSPLLWGCSLHLALYLLWLSMLMAFPSLSPGEGPHDE